MSQFYKKRELNTKTKTNYVMTCNDYDGYYNIAKKKNLDAQKIQHITISQYFIIIHIDLRIKYWSL